MTQPIRVFINGFGRIGRSIMRQLWSEQPHPVFELVGINDVAPLETCAYLLQYDSVFGRFPQPVGTAVRSLVIGGRSLPFYQEPDLRALDLSGVDVVLECTGLVKQRGFVEAGIAAGAANVLISGPSPVADKTIVLGANEEELGSARVVSNASCTTNAIAPLLRVLDEVIGVRQAHVTTIHCYTGSQPTVDQPGATFERSRAAAVSMVPTTTSAAHQIFEVLPAFDGRLSVAAVRVPTISVSAVDAVLQLAKVPDVPFNELLNSVFAESHLVQPFDDPCVSTDFRGSPASLSLSLRETQTVGADQVRVFGWYDNEWGFSARMLEMAESLARRP